MRRYKFIISNIMVMMLILFNFNDLIIFAQNNVEKNIKIEKNKDNIEKSESIGLENSISLNLGDVINLDYKLKNTNKKRLILSTDNDDVIRIIGSEICATQEGEAILIVETEDKLIKETCKVTVTDNNKILEVKENGQKATGFILQPGVTHEIVNTDSRNISFSLTYNSHAYDKIYYDANNEIKSVYLNNKDNIFLSPGEKVKLRSDSELVGFNSYLDYEYTLNKLDEPLIEKLDVTSNNSYEITNNQGKKLIVATTATTKTRNIDAVIYDNNKMSYSSVNTYGNFAINKNEKLCIGLNSDEVETTIGIPYDYEYEIKQRNTPVFYKFNMDIGKSYEIENRSDLETIWVNIDCKDSPSDNIDYAMYDNINSPIRQKGWVTHKSNGSNSSGNWPIYTGCKKIVGNPAYNDMKGCIAYDYKHLLTIRNNPVLYELNVNEKDYYEIYTDGYGVDLDITTDDYNYGFTKTFNYMSYNADGTPASSGVEYDAGNLWIDKTRYKTKFDSNDNRLIFMLPYELKDTVKRVDTPVFYKIDLEMYTSYKITNNTGSSQEIILDTYGDSSGFTYDYVTYDNYDNMTYAKIDENNDKDTHLIKPNKKIKIGLKTDLDDVRLYVPYELKNSIEKIDSPIFEMIRLNKNENYYFKNNTHSNVIMKSSNTNKFTKIMTTIYDKYGEIKYEYDETSSIDVNLGALEGISIKLNDSNDNDVYLHIPYEIQDKDEIQDEDILEPGNNNKSGAGQIKSTSYYSWKNTYSTIYNKEDVDWWKFDVKKGEGRLCVYMVQPKNVDYDIELYNEVGNLIGVDISTYDTSVIRYNLSKSGTYYLKVYGDKNNWSDSKKYRICIEQDPITDSTEQIGSEKAGWDHLIGKNIGDHIHYEFGGPLKVHIDDNLKNIPFKKTILKKISMYDLVRKGIDLWNDEIDSIPNKPSSLTKLIDVVPSDKQSYLSIEECEDPATSSLGRWTSSEKKITLNIPKLIEGYSLSLGKGVIAHELGHAMGLRDLYMSGQRGIDNRDKLMFGWINGWTHKGEIHSKDKLGLSYVQNWSKLKNRNKQNTKVLPKSNTINASYIGYNETELHQESSVIVKGTVKSTSSINEEGKIPKTKVELEIDKFYKNDKSNNEREIINFYHDGNQEMMVDKHYPLIEGDEVIVYLKSTNDGEYYVIGGTQGRFDIYEGDDDQILVMNHLEYNLQNEYEITENDYTVIFEPIKLSDFEAEIVETLENLPAAIYYNIPQMQNEYEWYNEDVTIEFSAEDDLYGVKEVSEDVILTKEGKNQSVEGYAINGKGLKSKIKVENINIDKTKPEIEFSLPSNLKSGDKLKLNCEVTDNLSGIDNVEIYVNGKAYNLNDEITLSTGKYNLEIKAHDKASNTSSQIINFNVSSNILGGGIEKPPVVVNPIEFTDIKGHWAEKTIEAFVKKGYINGYEDNTFRPNNSMTRAEFVKVVNKVFGYTQKGEEKFTDVNKDDWFYNDICIGIKEGYIKGRSTDVFAPNDNITREEVAMILTNIMKNKDENLDKLNSFKDGSKTSQWAQSSVEGAIEAGYLNGDDKGLLNPTNNITRAEAISMLSRVKK